MMHGHKNLKFMTISLSGLPGMRKNVSDKSCRKKIKKHSVYQNRAVYEITGGKYCGAGQAIDDNMAHAHYMLYN